MENTQIQTLRIELQSAKVLLLQETSNLQQAVLEEDYTLVFELSQTISVLSKKVFELENDLESLKASLPKPKKAINFNKGTLIEFDNDGDICEVIGSYSIRGKYCIQYRSKNNNKKYSDTRNDLLKWLNDGTMKVLN